MSVCGNIFNYVLYEHYKSRHVSIHMYKFEYQVVMRFIALALCGNYRLEELSTFAASIILSLSTFMNWLIVVRISFPTYKISPALKSYVQFSLRICVVKVQPWASCQIHKFEGCACAGTAGNVFPATRGQRSRHTSRHVRGARAVMYAGIA